MEFRQRRYIQVMEELERNKTVKERIEWGKYISKMRWTKK
jgi:hypothetical protein